METNGQANGQKSKKKDNGDAKDNLWSSILEEVQNQGNTKLPSNKNVLVLGDNETGKTTLVAKLQGVEDPKKGSALEYAYIDVRDEYRDDHTRLSVWVLDGDPGHTNLLKFALSEETFPHTLVILTVAMTTPWGILDQLQSWASVLGDHIDKLDLTPEQRLHSKKQQVQKWQRYTEPGDEMEQAASSPMKRSSRNLSDDFENGDDDDCPLPEGVLTTNLGLDIVVVVTKTDYMSTLEKEHDYRDEHFDFMQQWIRRFCLQYGAALFYTSAKEDKNCDLLYKYLTHRIYQLPFRTPALIVEKDAVLIPAGWDSMKKISILYENMQSCKPDDYYRDVIVQPAIRKSGGNREVEVQAEDEQAFLQRQLAALQAGAPAPARADSPLRATHRAATQLDALQESIQRMRPQLQALKKYDRTFFQRKLDALQESTSVRPQIQARVEDKPSLKRQLQERTLRENHTEDKRAILQTQRENLRGNTTKDTQGEYEPALLQKRDVLQKPILRVRPQTQNQEEDKKAYLQKQLDALQEPTLRVTLQTQAQMKDERTFLQKQLDALEKPTFKVTPRTQAQVEEERAFLQKQLDALEKPSLKVTPRTQAQVEEERAFLQKQLDALEKPSLKVTPRTQAQVEEERAFLQKQLDALEKPTLKVTPRTQIQREDELAFLQKQLGALQEPTLRVTPQTHTQREDERAFLQKQLDALQESTVRGRQQTQAQKEKERTILQKQLEHTQHQRENDVHKGSLKVKSQTLAQAEDKSSLKKQLQERTLRMTPQTQSQTEYVRAFLQKQLDVLKEPSLKMTPQTQAQREDERAFLQKQLDAPQESTVRGRQQTQAQWEEERTILQKQLDELQESTLRVRSQTQAHREKERDILQEPLDALQESTLIVTSQSQVQRENDLHKRPSKVKPQTLAQVEHNSSLQKELRERTLRMRPQKEINSEDKQVILQRLIDAQQSESSLHRASHNTQLDTKIGMGPGTPGNEGVLANFFNSLLYKKTGSPGARAPEPSTAAARSDAAAELDRLTRGKPRPPPPAAPLDLNSSEC